MSKSLIFLITSVFFVNGCYWNSKCPHVLFGPKTPYDTVREDIRDYVNPENCEAVSIWSINRHGNRNPGITVTADMKDTLKLRTEAVASFTQNRSSLCTQDIDDLSKWIWNSTLEESQSYLTGTGYEEVYTLAKRIKQKYGHLIQGSADDFYFRPTNEQRTVTSCIAFVRGLTDGIDLSVIVDSPWKKDDVIRPYQNCDRYQQEVKRATLLADQIESYTISPDFIAVQKGVQKRLGLNTQLAADNILSMYEICRFHRSWAQNLRDPWCAAFSDEELHILEYYDDIRHYYKNGYGSIVNVDLGKAPLKDLYNNFNAVVNGSGKKLVAYFTHDTMMEMVWCAMGLYKDRKPIDSLHRNPKRLWRTSFIGAFSTNLIAVLNRCNEGGSETYRVQLFINEAVTPICPANGCTWQEFQDKFQVFSTSNLDFCSVDFQTVHPEPVTNSLETTTPLTNDTMSQKGWLNLILAAFWLIDISVSYLFFY